MVTKRSNGPSSSITFSEALIESAVEGIKKDTNSLDTLDYGQYWDGWCKWNWEFKMINILTILFVNYNMYEPAIKHINWKVTNVYGFKYLPPTES